MFFARLAIAALSFGSAATVFAAPLVTVPAGVAVGVVIPGQSRGLAAFPEVVETTTTKLQGLKTKIDTLTADSAGAATPELAAVINQVSLTLAPISEELSEAGVTKESLLATTDGVIVTAEALTQDMSDMADALGHIISELKAKNLKSLDAIKPSLIVTKEHVDALSIRFTDFFPNTASSVKKELELAGVIIEVLIEL
ncbi:hypothetical protein FRC09_015858 [Ceratobasidium sp. 395]|nr:hypothetical protein FRC09_015858 [Ceratobasidium sp. 395]